MNRFIFLLVLPLFGCAYAPRSDTWPDGAPRLRYSQAAYRVCGDGKISDLCGTDGRSLR